MTEEVARQIVEHTIPLIMQWDENFDIGADTGTSVDDADYQVPFRFTGKLNKLTLKIDRPKLTTADEKRLEEAAAKAADAASTGGNIIERTEQKIEKAEYCRRQAEGQKL